MLRFFKGIKFKNFEYYKSMDLKSIDLDVFCVFFKEIPIMTNCEA